MAVRLGWRLDITTGHVTLAAICGQVKSPGARYSDEVQWLDLSATPGYIRTASANGRRCYICNVCFHWLRWFSHDLRQQTENETLGHLNITMPTYSMWIAIIKIVSWPSYIYTLQWHHNGRGNVSNHQPHDCLLTRLLRRRSRKTSKLCVTGLCVGNSPGTGEIPAQMASNAENVSMNGNPILGKVVILKKASVHVVSSLSPTAMTYDMRNDFVEVCVNGGWWFVHHRLWFVIDSGSLPDISEMIFCGYQFGSALAE